MNSKNFKTLLDNSLCKLVGYYDGRLKKIKRTTSDAFEFIMDNESSNIPSIVIVHRKFYTEKNVTLPIDDEKALKKYLALEYGNQNTHYNIVSIQDGESIVNVWSYNEEVPKAKIVIPESVLIAQLCNNEQVIEISRSELFFVIKQRGLIASLLETSLINTVEHFLFAVAAPEEKQVIQLAEASLPTTFINTLKIRPLTLFTCFINFPQREQLFVYLKKALLPVGVVLTGYLALSSAYLMYEKDSLESALQKNNKEISQAITVQKKYAANVKQYQGYRSFVAKQQNHLSLWNVLLELFPQAQFSNIRKVNNRYVLRGKVAKAIHLLETISQLEQVKDAKFDYPIRKARKQEAFVISFQLETNNSNQFSKGAKHG